MVEWIPDASEPHFAAARNVVIRAENAVNQRSSASEAAPVQAK